MIIKHDYSYIKNDSDKLIEEGYLELDIHSLNFDRHYTEEEKENNRKQSESMTREEWNIHCDDISKEIHNKLIPIKVLLNSKYDVHQISEDKNTIEHYKSNWDLYYYGNKGWNERDYFDYMKISFNGKREVKQNKKLLQEVLELLEELEVKNICCRVQYDTRRNEEKIKNKTIEICESLLNKVIDYNGMKGKIKVLNENEHEKTYGFIKSRTRNHYYSISDTYMILNFGM